MIDWGSFVTIVAAIIVAQFIMDAYRHIQGRLADRNTGNGA